MKRVENPPNPYETVYRDWLGEPPRATVEVYEETARSILSENDSPDLPFRWSANPYRGCQHACAYCYARPYHEYLGLGAGTDFETRLIVKVNAPELLADALRRPSWSGECVHFSGITDCYQPLEAVRCLTKRCLEVCQRKANPVAVVTKSCLVRRDADLLSRIERGAGAHVCLSIPFADDREARCVEPQAPPPSRRFEAMKVLRDAGVPVGIFIAPVIPGLNDDDIPELLERAASAGACSATLTPLRLPGSVKEVFLSRIRRTLPGRARRIENRLRDIRHGALDDARFGCRMRGEGVYWEAIQRLFDVSARRFGLDAACSSRRCGQDVPTPRGGQLSFGF